MGRAGRIARFPLADEEIAMWRVADHYSAKCLVVTLRGERAIEVGIVELSRVGVGRNHSLLETC